MARRVVVTGMGTVNPLGNSVKDFWAAVKAGENGIGKLTRFDVSQYPARIAGEVKDFAPEKLLGAKEARRMDRFTQYAMVASIEAMADAGLAAGTVDPERLGVILGNGIGGIETLEDNFRKLIEQGPEVHPPAVRPHDDLQRGGGQHRHPLPGAGPLLHAWSPPAPRPTTPSAMPAA